MKANFYSDIVCIAGTSHVMLSQAINAMHKAFGKTDNGFALAFPGMKGEAGNQFLGNRIRVFCDAKEDLELLSEELSKVGSLAKNLLFSLPKAVPADFSGNWYEYSRLRIPTNKDISKNEKLIEKKSRLIEKSLSVPYFKTVSRSNGNKYSIGIVRKKGVKSNGFTPSSFGLSTNQEPFALPDLQ